MKLHASGEDYLETILVLHKKMGMVRSVDVARHMEVSKPSVCHAVATLRDGGFLTMDEDHLNLAALAFGTMAEDGNLKFITSLTSVGSTYDSVKGSAQGMFDATTTPMQEMESNTRKLKESLVPLGEKLAEIANTILPPLVSMIQTVSGWFQQLPEPVQNFIVILGSYTSFGSNATVTQGYTGSVSQPLVKSITDNGDGTISWRYGTFRLTFKNGLLTGYSVVS